MCAACELTTAEQPAGVCSTTETPRPNALISDGRRYRQRRPPRVFFVLSSRLLTRCSLEGLAQRASGARPVIPAAYITEWRSTLDPERLGRAGPHHQPGAREYLGRRRARPPSPPIVSGNPRALSPQLIEITHPPTTRTGTFSPRATGSTAAGRPCRGAMCVAPGLRPRRRHA